MGGISRHRGTAGRGDLCEAGNEMHTGVWLHGTEPLSVASQYARRLGTGLAIYRRGLGGDGPRRRGGYGSALALAELLAFRATFRC